MKILFLCKKNETYGFQIYSKKSSGLYNSTQFIVESLKSKGIDAKIEEVVDGNSIDREVYWFKPDKVIIEALWVTPDKMRELKRLHPTVKWYVHLHSNIPFLAIEGIAIEWLKEYDQQQIVTIANSKNSIQALKYILQSIIYLPNIYLSKPMEKLSYRSDCLFVACFVAIRPMKNQLIQAMAAIEFSHYVGKKLKFHVNSSRVETNGDPVLKNLRALLGHDLIEHRWYQPDALMERLNWMDLGMQVSLSETFNVVTADYVTAGIPVVVSKEIPWVESMEQSRSKLSR